MELDQLEFLFDNIIQLAETRSEFIKFLELEKHENLLYYYESVSNFTKKLQREIKGMKSFNSGETPSEGSDTLSLTSDVSQISQSRSPKSPNRSIANSSLLNLKTSISGQGNSAGFDLYYEVEILLQDYLQPNGKRFIPYYEVLNKKLMASIKERKAKQLKEDDENNNTELEDAEFYGTIFQDFTNSVYTKLKHDIFPRFVRGEDFHEFLEKYKEQDRLNLLNKISKKQNTELHKILYTEKEFNEEHIREKEIMFTFQLVHDNSSIWTPVFHVDENDEGRASCYYTNYGFMSDSTDKEFLLLKFMGYIPHNVEDVIKVFLNGSYNLKSDPSILSCSFLEFITPVKEEEDAKQDFLMKYVASSVCHSDLNFGPFLTKRDCVSNTTIRYFPHLEEYLLVNKPTIHNTRPEKKKPIRAKFLSGWCFERIAANETRFTFLSYTQMGGWLKKLGKGVVKMAKTRAKSYVETITKLTDQVLKEEKKTKEDYFNEPLEKNFGMAHTLKWHLENISTHDLKQHYKGFSHKNLFDLKKSKTLSKTVSVRF